MNRLLPILFAASLSVGCKKEETLDPKLDNLGRASGPVEKAAGATPIQQMPDARPMSPPHGMKQQPGTAGKIHTGQVLEAIDASRYTYVRLQVDSGEEMWGAVPKVKLVIGQPIALVESIVMRDFESKTLGRKFSTIIFGVLEGDDNEMPAGN